LVKEAAAAAGVSRRTAFKWLKRFEEEGQDGLTDRSSRPRRIARRLASRVVQQIERLRRRRHTALEIAAELGQARSTVSRVLSRLGLGKLWRVLEAEAMLHVDAKKFGRIQSIGHRIHGDRTRRGRGAGWEVVFVCVDDHTRLAYAEVFPSESGCYATTFLRRALHYFEGLNVRSQRVLTDNAKAYGSNAFQSLCQQAGVRHCTTRPYTPRTNGKAERFIQTLQRRWAYRRPYRTSALRTDALRPWLREYNHHRPHRALGMMPPIARLREARSL
jgi:transposase InsO family protein